MYIAELVYPGTWLDYPEREWCQVVESLLRTAELALAEAAIALTWFELEQQRMAGWPRQESETKDERIRELESRIAAELGVAPERAAHNPAVRFSVDIESRRESWKRGVIPDSYHDRMVYLHAKTFLWALDRIEKVFGVLASTPDAPGAVAEARKAFAEALPTLRGVRDSVAHHEDRSRGLGKGGKPLELKPVDNKIAHAPAGVLILESLVGSSVGATMTDGSYGEIDVTPTSLETAKQLVQASIDSFRWKGPPHHWPR